MAEPYPDDAAAKHGVLLHAIVGKDRRAFSTLFEHYAPRIKAMMIRGGLAAGQAEELAQETMLTVWRKADLYDPAAGSAAAWIFTIARNRRIDLARSAKRAPTEGNPSEVEQVDDQPLPDAMLAAAETERRVRTALTQLSEAQQTVLKLSFFDNLSHSEIAETLSLPLGTVKSRIRLAFQRLRDLLGDLK